MKNTHLEKIKVAPENTHNPKVDHNISLAGLLLTDADTVIKKMERESKGILKGLYAFRKRIPTGEVYICNGAEFPNSDAVDLLLYLLVKLEEKGWERKITFKSIRELLKEVFGEKSFGKTWINLLKRILVIWQNHSFYFDNSFVWQGQKITTMFGVIDDWEIKSQGRGKPAKVTITFNEKFLKICKGTDWYRRPPWLEIRKLRKETAKRLYMVSLEYRPNEGKSWKIYIDGDLKYWYRNTLNSLANPKHLRPSTIRKRLESAIEEINEKTNLKMELQQTEEGNYCILVEEIAPPGTEALEIPFDKLSDEEKAILITYVENIAKQKGIKNTWGFLRAMSSRQVKTWLRKAKKYFESQEKIEEFTENKQLLDEFLNWAKSTLKPHVYQAFFDKKIIKAYENNKEIVFVCVDKYVKDFCERKALKEAEKNLGKRVRFTVEESE